MRKQLITLFFVCLSVIVWAQKPFKTTTNNDEWKILWSISDEFNDATPNWAKWNKSSNLPNTTGWKWDNANNVKINNGVAELAMTHNVNNQAIGGTYFESGILKSYRTMTYGYYEAKIKGAHIGEGVCPSFWLFSDFDRSAANGQPVYCEVDIVELQQFDWWQDNPTGKLQDDIHDMDLNLHAVVKENGTDKWKRPKMFPDAQLNKYRVSWDPRDAFHIYGCEVNKDEIIWYVDGVEVARKDNTFWTRPMNITLSLGLRKPFVKFYDNANHAVNPLTDSDANAKLSDIPTKMYVDYVRVWEKQESSTVEPTDPTPVEPTTPSTDGEFYIKNKQTGQNLRPATMNNSAEIHQTATVNNFAKWVKVNSDGDWFHLKNVKTGKYLRPTNSKSGSKLIQTNNKSTFTQWKKVGATTTHFYLKNRSTNMYFRPVSKDDMVNESGYRSCILQRPTSVTGSWTQWTFDLVNSTSSLKSGFISPSSEVNEAEISFYPNPASDILNLKVNSERQNEELLVKIYSITGVLVKTKEIKSGTLEPIVVSDLQAGIYILKVGEKKTIKFRVQ